jgi:hypothetical protein
MGNLVIGFGVTGISTVAVAEQYAAELLKPARCGL